MGSNTAVGASFLVCCDGGLGRKPYIVVVIVRACCFVWWPNILGLVCVHRVVLRSPIDLPSHQQPTANTHTHTTHAHTHTLQNTHTHTQNKPTGHNSVLLLMEAQTNYILSFFRQVFF